MHRIGERAVWLAVLTTLVSLGAAAPASAAHTQSARKLQIRHATLGLVSHTPLLAPASAVRNSGSDDSHHGLFSLTISPNAATPVASGQKLTIKAKITNESSSQSLGSADLFAPFVPPPGGSFNVVKASTSAGTATLASNCPLAHWRVPCVELRGAGLAPHASLTVTMTVQTPVCEQGAQFFWLADAEQSGNFGVGESGGLFVLDLAHSQLFTALDGACKLAFVTGPTDALPGAVITGSADDPSGASLTVDVVDSHGAVVTDSHVPVAMSLSRNPTAATLSGTRSGRASSGVATFSDLSVNLPGTGYRMRASSGGLTPAASAPFDISGNSATCEDDMSCQVTDTNPTGSVNIVAQAGAGTGELVEATEAPLTDGECAGYDTLDQNGYVYESTVARSTVVTITIIPQTELKEPPIKVLQSQEICFGATQEFTDDQGQLAPAATLPDGMSGFVGLLPNCSEGSTGPCHDRSQDKLVPDDDSPTGFDIVLVANVPSSFAGDPHMS